MQKFFFFVENVIKVNIKLLSYSELLSQVEQVRPFLFLNSYYQ